MFSALILTKLIVSFLVLSLNLAKYILIKMIIDFYKYRIIAFSFSIVLLVSSVLLFLNKTLTLHRLQGRNNDRSKFNEVPNISNLREKIENLGIGNSEIQEFGDPSIILFKLEDNSDDNKDNNSIIENLKG